MMNEKPLLTIGMAHYQDFSGLWATIQSLRLNNLGLMPQVQFVVVNNSPEDKETGRAIRNLLVNTREPQHTWEPVYAELTGIKGTSASRNAIFEHAAGKYVVVMDCHLELAPQSLQRLMDYYSANPETSDLLSGPLINDTLKSFSTHFRDHWDDGMWGQWSQAWQCQCGQHGSYFDLERVTLESGTNMAMPRRLAIGNIPISECEACHKPIPDFTWEQHEPKYIAKGFTPVGANPGPAFEIPGQGLGFFSCRKDAWLGFNQHARAFGAEELCIHEKYRRAGHKSLCVPGVIWCHRFYREGGAKYPNTNYDKARNYVLWFNELGMSLEPVRRHFVEQPIRTFLNETPPREVFLVSPDSWEALVEDPINSIEDPGPRKMAAEKAATLLPHLTTVDALFDEVYPIRQDLDQHMPAFRTLAELAGGAVVEFTGRRQSTIAFLAGRPKAVTSYSTDIDNHCLKAGSLVSDTTRFNPRQYAMGSIVKGIPENDLLFIDTYHRYGHVLQELAAYAPQCRRFIVLHDTEIYGERGDDGGLGLRQAIAEWCDHYPEWAVIDHSKEQYGLTVLSRNLDDRPEQPVEGFNVPHGPGTELKKILHSLGIHPAPNCGCNSRAAQMDIWGIEGCEVPENYTTITGWLRDGVWSGLDMAGAVARSFFNGLAWQINPLNPFESLVDLCLKRAKESEAKRAKAGAA